MKRLTSAVAVLLGFILVLSGCTSSEVPQQFSQNEVAEASETISEKQTIEKTELSEESSNKTDLDSIPVYSGSPYVTINDGKPFFNESEYTTKSFERYSPLDNLGRCGVAYANIGKDIMPTEDRGSIGMIKPSGWHSIRYENVDGKYLYNRCHLIGFQLSAENANESNLITGTRYLNVEGMLPFENMVADYVKETNNHVLYRVTPIFKGENLLASGVLMEGWSVEDDGNGICFNVYCYNVQPGIKIDYATGESEAVDGSAPYGSSAAVTTPKKETNQQTQNASPTVNYIANKNSKKLHYTWCHSVDQMKESNKVYLSCTREQALSQGYSPCGNCIGK